ncbi:MAG: class I SAM-dependent methyltransferase [Planctomycetaceae bacterium]|nr:class I SAM-dependent methyltransferase [Planctomycetaceae bacterium]
MISPMPAPASPRRASPPVALQCPNCQDAPMREFHQVPRIAVHSCILVNDRDAARDFPAAPLALGLCPRCGFIANTQYDASHRNYNQSYEETQGFSPRFNEFQQRLVRMLIDRYGVRGKNVLEIGCGKGEFLAQLCIEGDNRGIGIDPGCVKERLSPEAARRMTVINDYYGPEHADLPADVICCRHTLEHIPQTRRFLESIRRAIGDRHDTLVFFEVPDTLRILEDLAFWDVYYEHCSYFTCGSLARLFRSTGFEIESLDLDFDGQYIMLLARPAPQPTRGRLAVEDDLARTATAAEAFAANADGAIKAWRQRITTVAAQGRRCVLWGSGSKAVAFLAALDLGGQVQRVVDINPYRRGRYMPLTAQPIVSPEDLASCPPDYVVVMNPIYEREIREQLSAMNLAPTLWCV